MSMSTPLIASIKPRFQTIDGLRIRHADSGGTHGADGPAHLSLAGEHLRVCANVGGARRACPYNRPGQHLQAKRMHRR
jgi:hypothetical protein